MRCLVILVLGAVVLVTSGQAQQADRVLSGNVVLAAGFQVPASKVWEFDPKVSTTVTVEANVIVEGTLRMRPAARTVVHRLQFAKVDESKYRGGGMSAVASDVGLWVVGAGQLEIEGTPRTPWAYDWQPEWDGDEVLATPFEPGEYVIFQPWSKAKGRARNRIARSPELLDLTRNVIVSGTPQGRAHVLIRSTQPQRIRFAAFANLGPRQLTGGYSTGVLGRYPVHFHHCGDGSRGSLLEGCVVRASGNRGFVPHASHGVTIRRCIVHDCFDDPYWWDPPPEAWSQGNPNPNATHDVKLEGCVAALVRSDPSFRGYRLTGFALGNGERNACIDCVAVAVQGNKDSSGFHWPEKGGAVWLFERNLAHNNRRHGSFTWQNGGDTAHRITMFVAYYNGGAGISHGAYANRFLYESSSLIGNGEAGVTLHAVSKPATEGSLLCFRRIHVVGDGITPYGFRAVPPQPKVGLLAARIEKPCIEGVTVAEFVIDYQSPLHEIEDRFEILR